MNPDCRSNLWNMIDAYKKEREENKEKQVTIKTNNAAQQFRKINTMQKELEVRARK